MAMKNIKAVAFLFAFWALAPISAQAQGLINGIEDMKVFVTTGTPVDVLNIVASSTTLHAASKTTKQRFYFVAIENLHPTASLWASGRSNVTVQSDSDSLQGNQIKPGKWKYWVIRAGDPFYVVSDSSLASGTSAYITVGR